MAKADKDSDADQLSEQELVARARNLGPGLAARRVDTAAARRISAETIAELVDAQLLRASMPARFGGFELPFGAHIEVAIELGKYCDATSWVAGILSSHNWWLGKFLPEAQHDLWDDNPDVLTAAAFAHTRAEARRVDGGFRVSGEWVFCSGVDNCHWSCFMAPLPREAGDPEMSMVLLPKQDFAVKDVWHSPGMSGTGSNNVVLDDVFIPAHRTASIQKMDNRISPGAELNDSATYRLPTLGVFAYSVAAPIIGIAQGALASYVEQMSGRARILSDEKISAMAATQLRISEASAEIDSSHLLLRADIDMVRAAANADRDLTPKELARIKRNCAYLSRLCRQASARLVEAQGARGLKLENPVYMAHNDIIAGTSHIALAWDVNAAPYGRVLFGLNP